MTERLKFLSCIGLCLITGYLGSYFNAQNLWYFSLNKPPFTPPSWVFAPVWTILYTIMGISLYYFISSEGNKHDKNLGYIFFGAQLILNLAWSITFFGIQSVGGGLIVILLLLLMIAITMIQFYVVSKKAAYLLLPYFLWVAFASVLNYSIYRLNQLQ